MNTKGTKSVGRIIIAILMAVSLLSIVTLTVGAYKSTKDLLIERNQLSEKSAVTLVNGEATNLRLSTFKRVKDIRKNGFTILSTDGFNISALFV
ncbi:hypothetical protein BEN83_03035 [Ligilactobacillus agilis]|nr:hypothetical protein BEN83_03035 [Ligilactobacillus agilis]